MEAGYDYTLMGGGRSRNGGKFLPAVLVAVLAGILLLSGLAYFGFNSDAQADLAAAQTAGITAEAAATGNGVDGSTAVRQTRKLSPASPEQIAGHELYPAGFTEARYWVNPLGYE